EPRVYARYFKGYRPQTLGRKKITEALRREVFEKRNEALADIMVLLWNQAHRDVYQAMLEHVKTISEDVETIERIEDDKAEEFTADLEQSFDKTDILICVCLNEVRFSPKFIDEKLVGSTGEPPATGAPAAKDPDVEPEDSESVADGTHEDQKNP
ncbi:MAG: hypothetical protein GXP54_05540, partial [Deltaproteobacteria bacterium]|nr:hypothetical protein [Deltaproteobacteria bacterium]